jgi:hypothetical protein
MSDYQNEAGEWLMDGAAIRTEWALDAQSAEERFEDDFYGRYDYDEPEALDPEDCEHGDGSYPEDAGFDCDGCDTLLLGPRVEYTDPNDPWGLTWDAFFSRNLPGGYELGLAQHESHDLSKFEA